MVLNTYRQWTQIEKQVLFFFFLHVFQTIVYGPVKASGGKSEVMQSLECSEARLRPRGSYDRLGRVPLLPRVEGTGPGPSHGYRAVDPGHTGTPGSGAQCHNTEHETQARGS